MNACVECFSRFISPSLSLLQTLRESVAWKLSCCSLLQTLRESAAWKLSCCSLLWTLRESATWKLSCCSLLRTLRIEFHEEVTCCSGAWLVIQLGGGVEQTVELLPPMVGRS